MAIFEIIEKSEGENNVTALSEFILQEMINQKDYLIWIFVVYYVTHGYRILTAGLKLLIAMEDLCFKCYTYWAFAITSGKDQLFPIGKYQLL